MNRWKNYLWMAAGVAALTLVALFTAKPLLAQIKAAFVENVDEPGRNPYQETIRLAQGSNCSGAFCNANFSVVPSGKRLVITNISGAVFVDTPGVIQPVWLNGLLVPAVLQTGTYPNPVNNSNMLGFNASIRRYYEAFQSPGATITSTTNISFDNGFTGGSITLSGYYVNLP